MPDILNMNITIGDEHQQLIVGDPHEKSGWYQVYIDNYYHGSVFKRNGVWEGHYNQMSWLTPTETDILGEMIDERKGKA